MADKRLPKAVVFDLDYTLWDLWIDTHITGPLKRSSNALNEVVDRHGETISFYSEVPTLLNQLRDSNIYVAAASRTSAPRLARQALDLLLILPPTGSSADTKPMAAARYFDQLEIYPGSKLTHFKKIHEKTGIPYEEMLFFDDESRNKEVEKLGVTMCLVTTGVDLDIFERGLRQWRRRYPAPKAEEELAVE